MARKDQFQYFNYLKMESSLNGGLPLAKLGVNQELGTSIFAHAAKANASKLEASYGSTNKKSLIQTDQAFSS